MEDIAGVVLCGGLKRHLFDTTGDYPPLFAELKSGYSVLDKQIFEFKCAGIEEIYMISNDELSKRLKKYIKKYKDIKISVFEEDTPMGSVGALLKAFELIERDLIVRNADIVTDINMVNFVSVGSKSKFPVTIFITKLPSPYGVVHVNSDYIVGFEEKPILQDYINAGVYYFKRDIVIPEVYKNGKIENTIFPEFAKKRKMGFYEEDVFWRALKTPIDLQIVKKEYENKVDKAWGYEKIIINTDKYLTKELFLREGLKTSFHQHEEKDETMYVKHGRGYIEFEDGVTYFSANDRIRIKPKTPHSIVALENTFLYEISTPHVKDTTRIKDFYPRDTE
ncbi:MAG: sugar phosphate nucleotidyltransferase [Candidatus Methanofastidiosia archaeon]